MQEDNTYTPWLGCLVLALTVTFIGGVGYVWILGAAIEAAFEGNSGPVKSLSEWPGPLKELSESAAELQMDLSQSSVYCVANGLSVEYLWAMESTPGLIELAIQQYRLTEHEPTFEQRFRSQDWTPAWWNPKEDPASKYYCGNLGGMGGRYVVFDDQLSGTIFVHYIFD